MGVVWFVAGISVFAVTAADIVGSLLGDEGDGGVVTGRLARLVWRGLGGRRRRGRHRSSHLVGRLIVLSIPVSWLVAMWIAWTLVFTAGTDNVVASDDQDPASTADKAYYVGYLLVTLGNGEFQPSGRGWQFASVAASATGFAVLTLGVTFIVPIVQAATTRRRTAALIATLGTTTEELREALASSTVDIEALSRQIVTLTEEHGAFPVLHFLHTREASRSAPTMIARLALAAESVDGPDSLRRALNGYLRFHPDASLNSSGTTWTDVLRDDGRTVTPWE